LQPEIVNAIGARRVSEMTIGRRRALVLATASRLSARRSLRSRASLCISQAHWPQLNCGLRGLKRILLSYAERYYASAAAARQEVTGEAADYNVLAESQFFR